MPWPCHGLTYRQTFKRNQKFVPNAENTKTSQHEIAWVVSYRRIEASKLCRSPLKIFPTRFSCVTAVKASTLSCPATIMMKWLIPRLIDFKRENPEVEFRLNMSRGEVDFVRDKVSLAIRTSIDRPPPDAIVEPLLREQIGPVCHPEYASRVGLTSVASLTRARILNTVTRPPAWEEWAALMNCGDIGLNIHEEYEHFYLVIEAASAQLGVALAPMYAVEKEIKSGQLVAPFGFIDSPHTLNLWIAPHERLRDDVRRLAAWIKNKWEGV